MRRYAAIVILCTAIVLGSCTTGQQNVTPNLTFTPTNAVLKMSVGTVNFAGAAVGLNVLATDRGPNGYTAIPDNTATLTGPPGFVAPPAPPPTTPPLPSDPGTGSGSVPLGAALNAFPLASNITILAAADGFGIGPPGSSSSSISPFPMQPQFWGSVAAVQGVFATGQIPIYGGVPAYPAPSGPVGYPEGFYLLALSAAPPTGTYTLTVSYSQNGNPGTQTATASLGSNVPLATFASAPTYASDGSGGGSGTVTVPAGVSETFVQVTDVNGSGSVVASGTAVVKGAGTLAYAIPDSAALTKGDTVLVQAFGFDYDDLALGPPKNLSQTPSLPAQADVTISPQLSTTESAARHPLGSRGR